ncbi:RagB/SusD family nutrient uptake outer membrane protein [Chitinophaga sp. S165]|uniref:RagB/SusD family nutrient uptake outer membrane protein n=1 Tax=Chitinophaga sp. S165 TaxID=2135462 RepID=UPI0013049764|nr:RagB/SusD family nutrient uptake outer membrane protein [Chitinophaga sp. S165]
MLVAGLVNSCSDFLDVDRPRDRITGDQAFQNADTATRSVTGIYAEMSRTGNMIWGYTTVYAGICSDELVYTGTALSTREYFNGVIDPSNDLLEKWFWTSPYELIHHVNRCLQGLETTSALPPAVKNPLIGECRFLRALLYFHLVQLFGDVPLITGTDYTVTSTLPRASKDVVWQTILNDLGIAKDLLSSDYPSAGRVRANRWSAVALLARCYLYRKEWAMAEREATALINSGLYRLGTVENVFRAESQEAILQVFPTMTGYSTMEGFLLIPIGNVRPTFELSSSLLALFESGDKRKNAWVGTRTASGRTYYFPHKYKQRPDFSVGFKAGEYTTLFRLSEIYLIRAESRMALGEMAGAIEDLNVVRKRAGLSLISPAAPGSNEGVLADLIARERQVELFAEGGHRWFDLKRSGHINNIMRQAKTNWKSDYSLWPIPRAQIVLNPALKQNSGYP